jgi:RNA polymerase sigma-70 factor (ECF subfamily)
LKDVAQLSEPAVEPEPDLRERLKVAIDGLPDGYRTVFVMHELEGYTHAEIAAALGIQPGTSKAQLSRARARLRESLADYAEEWAS